MIDRPRAARYRALLEEALLVPCPSGTAEETFRVYEALEAGAVPILLRGAHAFLPLRRPPGGGGGADDDDDDDDDDDALASSFPLPTVARWADDDGDAAATRSDERGAAAGRGGGGDDTLDAVLAKLVRDGPAAANALQARVARWWAATKRSHRHEIARLIAGAPE